MDQFEIGGVKFKLNTLPLESALKGETILMQAIFPAIASMVASSESTPVDMKTVLGQIERLPELFKLFIAHTQVLNTSVDGGKWMKLDHMADTIFKRKPSLRMAYLMRCANIEYGDFLDANGLELIMAEVNRWTSLSGLIGESGESQPTQT